MYHVPMDYVCVRARVCVRMCVSGCRHRETEAGRQGHTLMGPCRENIPISTVHTLYHHGNK